jgi:hypothetical protein
MEHIGSFPGNYYVYGVTTDGFNPQVSIYSTGVVTINVAPTINIDQPDGIDDMIAEGANYTVQYDLADIDDTVTANFYYDTDNTGLDGFQIAGCQNRPEGNNLTCIWDTAGVAPGTYYVYGIVNDGTNPPVSTYSSGVVTINDIPAININEPDGIDDMIAQDANYTVNYDLADMFDTVTADFYYDTDNNGLDGTIIAGCQDRPEGVNMNCIWNTTGVAPGTYYVYGIVDDGLNPPQSVYSTGVVTINAAPTIAAIEPDGVDDTVTEGDSYTIYYDLADADDTVTANFYYDENGSGLDGTAIAGCQEQPEGESMSCTWDTTGVTPGNYYVYGVVNDGINPQVFAYSPGVVTILFAPTPSTIYLESGTSWKVPSDWNNSNNKIEVIGGGGGGANGASGAGGVGGGGGGGGGYSSVTNVSLIRDSQITILIGSGGSLGQNGGSTYFNGSTCGTSSVCATGGVSGSGTRAGGTASVGTGFSGGTGGAGGAAANGGGGGGGGAGAAGPNAAGNGGSVGSNASANTGGAGGAGGQGDGTSGGSGGTSGTSGGGAGGNGGNGTEWEVTHGSGGGAGGGGGANRNGSAGSAGTAGYYGAGGGGGGGEASGGTGPGNGSAGIEGLIVITYVSSFNMEPLINIVKPDGVDDTIAPNTNYTIIYDLYDPEETVTANFYYDTDNSGLDGAEIAGCQDRPEGTNATCVWDTTGVAPGDYYIYGVTSDGINAQQSAYSTGPVTINGTPTVNNVTLNGGANINLMADTRADISFTATVTDANGYEDIVSVTGKMYRSGVGQTCTADDNNCYTVSSCSLSGCSGNTCTATCTASVAFFADATDAGDYINEYWLAWIQATDGYSTTGEGYSPVDTTDMNSLLTISTSPSIAYSNVYPGYSSAERSTYVVNAGNRTLDLRVSGNNMCTNYPTCSGSQIAVGNQEYSLTSFSYGSGTALTSSLANLDTNIPKSSVIPSNSLAYIYWILGVPPETLPAVYTGLNTIVSIASP